MEGQQEQRAKAKNYYALLHSKDVVYFLHFLAVTKKYGPSLKIINGKHQFLGEKIGPPSYSFEEASVTDSKMGQKESLQRYQSPT